MSWGIPRGNHLCKYMLKVTKYGLRISQWLVFVYNIVMNVIACIHCTAIVGHLLARNCDRSPVILCHLKLLYIT